MIIQNYIKYLYISMLSFLLAACAKEEMTESKNEVEIDAENTATISYDGFYPGDVVTRSALEYGSKGLQFNWNGNEKFGIFPTGKIDENDVVGQNDSEHSSQAAFTLTNIYEGGQNAHISSDNSYFHFLSNYRYTAYTPYQNKELKYTCVPFNFSNQTQRGFVNMGAYYGTNGGYTNKTYKESEQEACKHLGMCDVLMSPETVSDERPLNFSMRHVGAVARFFLKIKDEDHPRLKIKEVKLIANKEIFYEGGFMDLTSHPYSNNDNSVPSADLPTSSIGTNNYGLDFTTQLKPDEKSKTNCLTLKFDDGVNNGVWNNYPTDATYGGYLLAYLMMYPINYTTTQASAYIYVVAEDKDGKDVRFQTKRLASKSMSSGYIYQWTITPSESDPIELTATLKSWQEIVSDDIQTGLE